MKQYRIEVHNYDKKKQAPARAESFVSRVYTVEQKAFSDACDLAEEQLDDLCRIHYTGITYSIPDDYQFGEGECIKVVVDEDGKGRRIITSYEIVTEIVRGDNDVDD